MRLYQLEPVSSRHWQRGISCSIGFSVLLAYLPMYFFACLIYMVGKTSEHLAGSGRQMSTLCPYGSSPLVWALLRRSHHQCSQHLQGSEEHRRHKSEKDRGEEKEEGEEG